MFNGVSCVFKKRGEWWVFVAVSVSVVEVGGPGGSGWWWVVVQGYCGP